MATFTLGIQEFNKTSDDSTIISRFEAGTEQRRQPHTNYITRYICRSPQFSEESSTDAYTDFWEARGGKFETFTWEGKTVRFDSQMTVREHYDRFVAEWIFVTVNLG